MVEAAEPVHVAVVAPGDDAGGAVGLGEVGERPDGVQLHVVALGEREEVERPLVAVDRLRRLARTDRDGLGEVHLERRGALEQPARGLEDQRVLQQLRDVGQRAVSAPVRRVEWPAKSSMPYGVAASHGSSSASSRSSRAAGARSSMTTAPSDRSTATTSSAEAVGDRCCSSPIGKRSHTSAGRAHWV